MSNKNKKLLKVMEKGIGQRRATKEKLEEKSKSLKKAQ